MDRIPAPVATITTECPGCDGRVVVVTNGTRAYAFTESPARSWHLWKRVEADAIVTEGEGPADFLTVECRSLSTAPEEPCGTEFPITLDGAVVGGATSPLATYMTEIEA